MKLCDHYLLEHPDNNDILIIQMQEPYLIAKIWQFTTHDQLVTFRGNSNAAHIIEIPGYHILLTSYTSLLNTQVTNIEAAYGRMANFFYEQRIEKNKSRYKRYES